jgi:hypothetical protein
VTIERIAEHDPFDRVNLRAIFEPLGVNVRARRVRLNAFSRICPSS